MKKNLWNTLIITLFVGLIWSCLVSNCYSQGQAQKIGFGLRDIIAPNQTFDEPIVLGARYWLSDELSLDGLFGFRHQDQDENEDEDEGEDRNFFLLGAGINQYLSPEEVFSPLIGVDFSLEMTDPGQGDNITNFCLEGKFGGEYFMAKRFSLSGVMIFELSFGDNTEIGTGGRLGLYYYLN